MEREVLQASRRTVLGKQVGALRRQGQLPGVLYGRHIQPIPISLEARAAERILRHMTASSLVNIELEGQTYPALVREKQRDPIRGHLLHVDFQAVSLTEKIRASVGVELVGEAPAVKNWNAILVTPLDALEVECLPQDLPERIAVDVSSLANIGDGIRVGDLTLAGTIRILNDPEETVVIAAAAEAEEVVAEAGAGAELEPEVIEKGKKEEEEAGEE